MTLLTYAVAVEVNSTKQKMSSKQKKQTKKETIAMNLTKTLPCGMVSKQNTLWWPRLKVEDFSTITIHNNVFCLAC